MARLRMIRCLLNRHTLRCVARALINETRLSVARRCLISGPNARSWSAGSDGTLTLSRSASRRRRRVRSCVVWSWVR